ncbi:response regulator [Thauera sp.]|jgi:CheY-like chemotaxis protein|uniref:response regulator n=1 Tax=Thauera sp. TaxID=1905334 RepID=UPI0026081AEF|nr:response regulator [Thauera sp.]MCK6408477.1 response regulator [Thauera sp.]
MNTLAFIIDDSAINVAVARLLLKRLGWSVEEFNSALPMLARLAEVRPAFMLLDISMPDMGGEEACRRIRARPEWADIRVIAYTAHAMDAEHQRYLHAGFDDILTKPVTLGTLEAAIGRAPGPAPQAV